MARLLARRLEERSGPTDAPLTVAELRRQLLPYPRCRGPADLASKVEYDEALLALLAEPSVLAVEDPDLSEAVERERSAAEPGLGFLDDFAAATLRPGPALLDRAAGEQEEAASAVGDADAAADADAGDRIPRREPEPPEPRPTEPRPTGAGSPAAGTEGAATEGPGTEGAGDGCRECGRGLPARDELRYCPWCGTDQTGPRCGSCREPVEPAWRYCPACGAATEA